MKAKYFKKLREKIKTYYIIRTPNMFGFNHNNYDLESYDEVMARTPKEAVKRYCKRKHWIKDLNNFDETPDETNLTFAKFMVLPKETPYKRFITYWH